VHERDMRRRIASEDIVIFMSLMKFFKSNLFKLIYYPFNSCFTIALYPPRAYLCVRTFRE